MFSSKQLSKYANCNYSLAQTGLYLPPLACNWKNTVVIRGKSWLDANSETLQF